MQVTARNQALDALRGLAILLMVLSSSISFGILPAWMYHAQVPPPYHVFKPEIPGITWVDLVFPFFLFTLGAAIPLALKKKIESQSVVNVILQIVQRYLLLVFFAVFTLYARAWVISSAPTWTEHLISIACFLLLFLQFTEWGNRIHPRAAIGLKMTAFLIGILYLAFYPFAKAGFDIGNSDIIIVVLANMVLFGSIIWWLTYDRPLWRIAILPLIMAVFLASKENGSWNSVLFNWSPAPWMYKFYYLKYLFIVLPGTLVGDWMLSRRNVKQDHTVEHHKPVLLTIAFMCISLVICNIAGLFGRWLLINLILTILLSLALLFCLSKINEGTTKNYYKKFIHAGVYLLVLGLFFDAYEGGIKKDYSTYSYYFVCTGLAFLTLLSLTIMEQIGYLRGLLDYLGNVGKNPMVAYTAGNLLLIPLLKLTGTDQYLDLVAGLPAGGFLRGIIFTGIVSLITLFCTRAKLFWKT